MVLSLCAGYFLVLLDVTIVNVALPSIGTSLGVGHGGLAWVVDAYTVPLAALLMVAGVVGDRIGHRPIVVAGFVLFGLASAVCAIAPTIGMLVLGRVIQGISAAMILPGTLALLTETARGPNERNRLVGIWAALGGIALPAGPLLGGLLVDTLGWRSVFWLNVPIVVLALIPVLSCGSSTARHSTPSAKDPQATSSATTGNHSKAQSQANSERSLPHLVCACAIAGLMNLTVLGTLFLLTQYLQTVRGLSPLFAGLATLPALVPLPLLGIVAGRMSGRLGVWRTSALGLSIGSIGFIGIGLVVAHGADRPVLLAPALAVWGCGIGLLTPAIVAAAMQALPNSPGTASGGSNTARQAGGAIGVALFAALAPAATSPEFTAQSSLLVFGAAGVFLIAMLACIRFGMRGQF